MAENPITFKCVDGNLYQGSFDESIRSLLCSDSGQLPWKKLWN